MRPDLLQRVTRGARAVMVGAALGVVGFAAGSLVLYQAGGVLSAAGGLVATYAAALAAGVWAGAPGARGDAPPTARWILAGVGVGLAGVVATVWTVYGLDRLGEAGRAAGLLLMVGVPVYAIGLLLPALAAWERGDGADSADSADSADDDGDGGDGRSIAPAVLAGAAVGAALSGLVLLPSVEPGPLLLGTATLLTFPLIFPVRRRAEETEEVLLHEAESPFGLLRVTEIVYPGKRQPERRLYQDEEVESGELVRSGAPTFAYIAAAERLFGDLAGARREDYLFLGGGAYTLPRRIVERDPAARITVVERDPEVTRIAQRFFGLRPEHRITSLHGDARKVAETLPAAAWDRVFVDVYDGSESVPYHLVTVEALQEYARLLKAGGVVVLNVIGVAAGEGERRFWSTVRTVREAFPAMRLYYHLSRDVPDRQNFLLAASPDPAAQFPAAAGTFEPWPEPDWPALPGLLVFRDRFPAGGDARPALPDDRERLDRAGD